MKKTTKIFLAMIGITLLSALSFQFAVLHSTLLFIMTIGLFGLALWKFEYAVLVLLAELFFGSKGHLFWHDVDETRISIRMALFGVVMLAWLIDRLRRKKLPQLLKHKAFQYILPFFIILAYAVFNGLQNYSVAQVFADANNWLYVLIVFPLFDVAVEHKHFFTKLSTLFKAAIAFLITKATFFFIVFALSVPWLTELLYHFERQTGGGQMAPAADGMWRIYFWSELFLIPAFFFALHALHNRLKKTKASYPRSSIVYFQTKEFYVLAAIVFALVLTLFRSFWVGVLVGVGVWFIVAVYKEKKIIQVIQTLTALVVSAVLVTGFVGFAGQGLAKIAGARPEIQKELFSAGEPGVQNRINQFMPLAIQIKQNPVLGSGFGTQITYDSIDPRTRGQVTTSALELGWLDMAMEIGVLGVLLFLMICGYSVVLLWGGGMNVLVIFSVLASLLTTHTFSPFLNHPLGLGLILLLFVYAIQHSNNFSKNN